MKDYLICDNVIHIPMLEGRSWLNQTGGMIAKYLKYITNDVYSIIFLSLVAFLRIKNYKNPSIFSNLIISSLL